MAVLCMKFWRSGHRFMNIWTQARFQLAPNTDACLEGWSLREPFPSASCNPLSTSHSERQRFFGWSYASALNFSCAPTFENCSDARTSFKNNLWDSLQVFPRWFSMHANVSSLRVFGLKCFALRSMTTGGARPATPFNAAYPFLMGTLCRTDVFVNQNWP